MKITKGLISSITVLGLTVGFSGCADSIAGAAGGVAGSIAGTALTVATGGAVDGASLGNSLGSSLASSAVKGATNSTNPVSTNNLISSAMAKNTVANMQGNAVVSKMAMNPALLGVGALATAQSQANMRENEEAGKKLMKMMNDPNTSKNMENKMVEGYNQQYGTNFKSMQDLQDYAKVRGWNEQEGTNFTTLSQVREDYNKKKKTSFATDKEFRDYIASNRR